MLTLLQFSQEYLRMLLWEIASCLISKGRWQNRRAHCLQGNSSCLKWWAPIRWSSKLKVKKKRRKCLEVQFKENFKWHQEPLYPPLSDWLSSQVGKLALWHFREALSAKSPRFNHSHVRQFTRLCLPTTWDNAHLGKSLPLFPDGRQLVKWCSIFNMRGQLIRDLIPKKRKQLRPMSRGVLDGGELWPKVVRGGAMLIDLYVGGVKSGKIYMYIYIYVYICEAKRCRQEAATFSFFFVLSSSWKSW